MSKLKQEKNGLIFEDTFPEKTLLWQLTPSNEDCLRFKQDGLHILHNENYVTYTIPEPQNLEEYCAIVHLTHKITNDADDIGGVIVIANTNDYAECQTFKAIKPSNITNNGGSIANGGLGLDETFVSYDIDSAITDDVDDNENESNNTDSSSVTSEDKEYQYIKINKYKNQFNNTYQFFASHNGKEWIEVGTVDFAGHVSIGFFLFSTETEELINNDNFIIHRIDFYENKNIVIHGINAFQEVEFLLDGKSVFRSDQQHAPVSNDGSKMTIDTTGFNLPMINPRLRIYRKGHYDDTLAQYDINGDIYGGSVFDIAYDIKVFDDNNREIKTGYEYDLGRLNTKSMRHIYVYNDEDFDLQNIKVSIVAYSEYYSGEQPVEIAFYEKEKVNQHPLSYNYSKELMIPNLESQTGCDIILKLSDIPNSEFYTDASQYKFKIIIE